jgi:hypothetical protein
MKASPSSTTASIVRSSCPTRCSRSAIFSVKCCASPTVFEHEQVHHFTIDLEASHLPARHDGRAVCVLDEHCHLADHRADLDWLSRSRPYVVDPFARARHHDIGGLARISGDGDSFAFTIHHALRCTGDLGDLQRLETLEEFDAQQRRHEWIDGHVRNPLERPLWTRANATGRAQSLLQELRTAGTGHQSH